MLLSLQSIYKAFTHFLSLKHPTRGEVHPRKGDVLQQQVLQLLHVCIFQGIQYNTYTYQEFKIQLIIHKLMSHGKTKNGMTSGISFKRKIYFVYNELWKHFVLFCSHMHILQFLESTKLCVLVSVCNYNMHLFKYIFVQLRDTSIRVFKEEITDMPVSCSLE